MDIFSTRTVTPIILFPKLRDKEKKRNIKQHRCATEGKVNLPSTEGETIAWQVKKINISEEVWQ
jgi:hypothetical protein